MFSYHMFKFGGHILHVRILLVIKPGNTLDRPGGQKQGFDGEDWGKNNRNKDRLRSEANSREFVFLIFSTF